MNDLERVAALRKRHRIVAVRHRGQFRCDKDGIRVHPIKTGFRHDNAEMEALNHTVATQEAVAAKVLTKP